MQSPVTRTPENVNQDLRKAVDSILEACSMASVLGAACSHWVENYSDMSGASDLAFRIRSTLLIAEEHLHQLEGQLYRKGLLQRLDSE